MNCFCDPPAVFNHLYGPWYGSK